MLLADQRQRYNNLMSTQSNLVKRFRISGLMVSVLALLISGYSGGSAAGADSMSGKWLSPAPSAAKKNPIAPTQDSIAAGQVIASNDNWQTTVIDGTIITGNQVNEIQSNGFAPAFALESVLIATLPPGNYTAQLLGGTTPPELRWSRFMPFHSLHPTSAFRQPR